MAGLYNEISSNSTDTAQGHILVTKKQIQISTVRRPPTIIPRYKVEDSKFTSIPLPAGSELNYIIDIGNTWGHIIADKLLYNLLNADFLYPKTCHPRLSMLYAHL